MIAARASEALSGRRACVVGFGRSGEAAARVLLGAGASVRVLDGKREMGGTEAAREVASLGGVLDFGPHRSGQSADCDLVVLSPGVPPSALPVAEARAAGVEVIGEMELGARLAQGRLVGITGSNGKSTTTTLLARMLEASGMSVRAGGNLGTPLCAMLLEGDAPGVVHVLEVSSFQAETLDRARFDAAAYLNLSADHLDRYESLLDYHRAKARLLDRVPSDGTCVLNADDPTVAGLASALRSRITWFGLGAIPGPGVVVTGERVSSTIAGCEGELFGRDDLWTRAPHHLANAMAAAAMALAAGASREATRAGLVGFAGLPHRGEILGGMGAPRFVNDSKATNVDAAVRAVEGCDRGTVVIVGGRHKGGDVSPLVAALASRGDRAVLIGEAADVFAAAMEGRVSFERASSLEAAVARGVELAGSSGTVLLAPACASFDMFTNYEHRGDCFKSAAQEWIGDARQGGAR